MTFSRRWLEQSMLRATCSQQCTRYLIWLSSLSLNGKHVDNGWKVMLT